MGMCKPMSFILLIEPKNMYLTYVHNYYIIFYTETIKVGGINMSNRRRNRDRKRRFKNRSNSTNKIINIDQDECIGCGQCVTACPFDAIKLVDGTAQVIENNCRGCKQCIRMCPVQAITI